MATNFVTANYQEVIDLHTESKSVSIIGLHTPNTDVPTRMLSGFWSQFRKFRYNGCSVSLVPAARLPVDPLQVGLEAGEPTIDPRDTLNPILFHGCHGTDMGAILNQFYSSANSTSFVKRQFASSAEENRFQPVGDTTQYDLDVIEDLYYRAMTDTTWAKAHPQRGFRKSGLKPLVHRVVANQSYAQYAVPNGSRIMPYTGGSTDNTSGQLGPGNDNPDVSLPMDVASNPGLLNITRTGTLSGTFNQPADVSGQAFFTGRLEPLGWLDTHSVHTSKDSAFFTNSTENGSWPNWDTLNPLNTVPKIFMGMIMLPPAYKTEQYYRMVINHNFAFKDFRGASMVDNNDSPNVFNFN